MKNRAIRRGLVMSTAVATLATVATAAPASSGAAQARAMASPLSDAAIAVGIGAHTACASIFVSGRADEDVLRDDVHSLAPATRAVTILVDRKHRTVAASAPGTATRTAVYRPAVGCTLLTGNIAPAVLDRQVLGLRPVKPRAEVGEVLVPGASRRTPTVDRVALDAAMQQAFDVPNKGGYPDTRALLVVQNGMIVAEKYAPGFGRDTRFLGWSATKSITGTLVGMLVEDGVLDLDAPAPVPQWQAAGDPRRVITLRQLMNMASGLRFKEDYATDSDALRMMYLASNMGDFAASLPLDQSPGTKWSYSSGTTNILAGIVFRATGGTLKSMTGFARSRLFEPAGMTSALIEPDEAGVLVGSSYAYATARDWARFGQLYLDRGVVRGRQVISPKWVDFVRTPTTAAPRPQYGGQFWLNRGEASGPRKRMYADIPVDTYLALGHNAQIIAIIPSLNAVVVRMGWTPEGKSFDANVYLGPIIAALGQGAKEGDDRAEPPSQALSR